MLLNEEVKWRDVFRVVPGILSCCWFASADSAWSQLVRTDVWTDLAVDGPGWFIVRDPHSKQVFVTQRGSFYLDSDGYLVTWSGFRVQGYSDPGFKTQGDLRVDSADLPEGEFVVIFELDPHGRLVIIGGQGTQVVTGQLLLQSFQYPGKLCRVAYLLYAFGADAGPLKQPSAPGTPGLGELLKGYLDTTPEPTRLTLLPEASRTGALTEGVLTGTGRETDLGIRGPGFFLVRNTNTSELLATRTGMFLPDGDGYLVTYDGNRVQGYSDTARRIPGDVRISDDSNLPLAENLGQFWIRSDGLVDVTRLDGTSIVRSQIRLFTFHHPGLLHATNCGLYQGVTQAEPSELKSYGINAGYLEMINVPPDLLALREKRSFFSQGTITPDGIPSHLAIAGRGFFALRNPLNGETCVTRAGVFRFDDNGYLVTTTGLRVQGFADSSLSILGDLRLDPADFQLPHARLNSYSFDLWGKLQVVLDDEFTFIGGQVLLQAFNDPSLLVPSGGGLYTNLALAGPRSSPGAPGTAGLGSLRDGALEIEWAPDPLIPLSRHGVRLLITGEARERWTIETSSDLLTWQVLMDQTHPPEELEVVDTACRSHGRRFYRVLVDGPPSLSIGQPNFAPDRTQ